jgi:hypothetical protein
MVEVLSLSLFLAGPDNNARRVEAKRWSRSEESVDWIRSIRYVGYIGKRGGEAGREGTNPMYFVDVDTG